jgi:hypothetical protein
MTLVGLTWLAACTVSHSGLSDAGGDGAPDAPGDLPVTDSILDAPPPDVGMDMPPVDQGMDMPPVDQGMDMPTVDMAPGACRSNGDCRATQFCEFPFGTCAAPGQCVPRTAPICLTLLVCGCDGMVYDDDCDRRAAGVSRDELEACGIGPGCCRNDDDCNAIGPAFSACYGATRGSPGVCKRIPAIAGQCWGDRDCPGGACEGEFICSCGALCILPDSMGTCVANGP